MPEIAGEQTGRRRHARLNHARLVAAAREVLAEQGIDASLEEVARRAGVGIGTLYRHFSSRAALVEAIFERRIGELVAIADAAAAAPDGWSGFVALLERTLELQAGDRLLKEFVMRYPVRSPHLSEARADLRRRFELVLERARAEGSLRDDFTVADLTLLLWSFSPALDGAAALGRSAWRRHLHLLLDGLRAEAATPHSEPPFSYSELDAAMQSLRAR